MDAKNIICGLCKRPYTKEERRPRALLCGHTFCTLCLDEAISNKVCNCPDCNQPFIALTAMQLPTDFSILRRLTSLSSATPYRSPLTRVSSQDKSATSDEADTSLFKHFPKLSLTPTVKQGAETTKPITGSSVNNGSVITRPSYSTDDKPIIRRYYSKDEETREKRAVKPDSCEHSDQNKQSYGSYSDQKKQSYDSYSDQNKQSYASYSDQNKQRYDSYSGPNKHSYGSYSDQNKQSYDSYSDQNKQSYDSYSDQNTGRSASPDLVSKSLSKNSVYQERFKFDPVESVVRDTPQPNSIPEKTTTGISLDQSNTLGSKYLRGDTDSNRTSLSKGKSLEKLSPKLEVDRGISTASTISPSTPSHVLKMCRSLTSKHRSHGRDDHSTKATKQTPLENTTESDALPELPLETSAAPNPPKQFDIRNAEAPRSAANETGDPDDSSEIRRSQYRSEIGRKSFPSERKTRYAENSASRRLSRNHSDTGGRSRRIALSRNAVSLHNISTTDESDESEGNHSDTRMSTLTYTPSVSSSDHSSESRDNSRISREMDTSKGIQSRRHWSSANEERKRGSIGSLYTKRSNYDDMKLRSDRFPRKGERQTAPDRTQKNSDDDYKPKKIFGEDYKPRKTYDEDYKSEKTSDEDHKPKKTYEGDYKPRKTHDEDYKPKKTYDEDYKPKKTCDEDYKPKETYDKDREPKKTYDEDYRQKNTYDEDYIPKEIYGVDYRPKKTYREDIKPKKIDKDKRERTYYQDVKVKETYEEDDSPEKKYSEDNDPKETYYKDYKPKKTNAEGHKINNTNNDENKSKSLEETKDGFTRKERSENRNSGNKLKSFDYPQPFSSVSKAGLASNVGPTSSLIQDWKIPRKLSHDKQSGNEEAALKTKEEERENIFSSHSSVHKSYSNPERSRIGLFRLGIVPSNPSDGDEREDSPETGACDTVDAPTNGNIRQEIREKGKPLSEDAVESISRHTAGERDARRRRQEFANPSRIEESDALDNNSSENRGKPESSFREDVPSYREEVEGPGNQKSIRDAFNTKYNCERQSSPELSDRKQSTNQRKHRPSRRDKSVPKSTQRAGSPNEVKRTFEVPINPGHATEVLKQLPEAGVCRTHGSMVKLYCQRCEVWICEECLDILHSSPPRGQCHVVSASEALLGLKEEHSEFFSSRINTLNNFRQDLRKLIRDCDNSIREHEATVVNLKAKMQEEETLLKGLRTMKTLVMQKWQQVDKWEDLLQNNAERIENSGSSQDMMSAVRRNEEDILRRLREGDVLEIEYV